MAYAIYKEKPEQKRTTTLKIRNKQEVRRGRPQGVTPEATQPGQANGVPVARRTKSTGGRGTPWWGASERPPRNTEQPKLTTERRGADKRVRWQAHRARHHCLPPKGRQRCQALRPTGVEREMQALLKPQPLQKPQRQAKV
jgi:hypothetical protein